MNCMSRREYTAHYAVDNRRRERTQAAGCMLGLDLDARSAERAISYRRAPMSRRTDIMVGALEMVCCRNQPMSESCRQKSVRITIGLLTWDVRETGLTLSQVAGITQVGTSRITTKAGRQSQLTTSQ